MFDQAERELGAMSSFARHSLKIAWASLLFSHLSSNHGPATPSSPQTSDVEAPQPSRPQDDIESGGGAATTHNQHDALQSTEEAVLPFTLTRELSVLVRLASFLSSTFHGSTTPAHQTAAAAAPQPVGQAPLQGIESDGSTAPTTRRQQNALPSIENLAVPTTICFGVYALIPPQELIHAHPLCYSPFLASVFLTVLAANLSLLWHRTPHYHRRRRRLIEVAVISSVFSCLLRILLLLPNGKSLIFVAGFFFLGSGFAAIYGLSAPRHPNSLPV